MKKGQLLSQPFVWIFALILGALIMVWGVKTVIDLKETADVVDLGTFKNKLQSEAKAFYNYGEGSIKTIKVDLSGKVKFICFSNPGSPINCQYKKADGSLDSCPGGVKAINNNNDAFEMRLGREETKNMWFLPLGTAKVDAFLVNHVQPPSDVNPICYQNGRDITMESKGTYVELR